MLKKAVIWICISGAASALYSALLKSSALYGPEFFQAIQSNAERAVELSEGAVSG